MAAIFHATDAAPESQTDGGAVFPSFCRSGRLTVWDFYAGAALKGLLSGPHEHLQLLMEAAGGNPADALVDAASAMADQAMRAREERQVR
jgi:hypothetical protein